MGDLSFSQSRLDDCHGSEVSELECLVSDNNENNNVCEIYKSDYIHHPHQPEDVLEGHRDRRKDDSGCATASLEILSASCHTPATDLPSLNSLSLAREAEGWPQGEDKSRKTSRKTSNNSNHSGELLNSRTSSVYELNRNNLLWNLCFESLKLCCHFIKKNCRPGSQLCDCGSRHMFAALTVMTRLRAYSGQVVFTLIDLAPGPLRALLCSAIHQHSYTSSNAIKTSFGKNMIVVIYPVFFFQ